MAQSLITSETMQWLSWNWTRTWPSAVSYTSKGKLPYEETGKTKARTSVQTTGHLFSVHLHPEAEGKLLTRESHKTCITSECPSSTLVIEVSVIWKKQLVLSLQELSFF